MLALAVTAVIAMAIGAWLGYQIGTAPLDPSIDAFERAAGLVPADRVMSGELSPEDRQRCIDAFKAAPTEFFVPESDAAAIELRVLAAQARDALRCSPSQCDFDLALRIDSALLS